APDSFGVDSIVLTQGGNPVPSALAYDAGTRTATVTPAAPLQPGAQYQVTVSATGPTDLSGNTLPGPYSWSFTTSSSTGLSTYLSDMPWISAWNGWGPVERDRNNGENQGGDGGPLVINGTSFQKGLGAHANSDVRFDLGGACWSF